MGLNNASDRKAYRIDYMMYQIYWKHLVDFLEAHFIVNEVDEIHSWISVINPYDVDSLINISSANKTRTKPFSIHMDVSSSKFQYSTKDIEEQECSSIADLLEVITVYYNLSRNNSKK